jgi:hypothetical protein
MQSLSNYKRASKPPDFFLRNPRLAKYLYLIGAVTIALILTTLHALSLLFWFGILIWVITCGVTVFLFHVYLNLSRTAKRYQALISSLISVPTDSQPIILHLRSFGLELPHNFIRDDYVTDYEIINSLLSHLGQGVTAAIPHENLPPVSAAQPISFQDDSWQNEVIKLIQRAKLVVLYPGFSKGLIWEIRKLKEICPPEKVLLPLLNEQSLIFDNPQINYNRQVNLKSFSELFEQEIGVNIYTDDIQKSLFLGFEKDWSPEYIKFNASSDNSRAPIIIIEESLNFFLEKRGLTKGRWASSKIVNTPEFRTFSLPLVWTYFIFQLPIQYILNKIPEIHSFRLEKLEQLISYLGSI